MSQGTNGIAAFTDLMITGAPGPRTLTFTSSGLPPVSSNSVNVGVGAATQVVIVTQPSSTAQLGVPFSTQPVVKIVDANGNAVAQAGVNVDASIFAGGGTLTGTLTEATNASGVATFTNLAFNGNVGVRSLQFSSGSLIGATTSAISVTAGPATKLAISTPPSSSASSGVPLAVQPVVQVQDAGGNPSPTQGVTVTATVATGTGTLTNATATTNASGAATFSGLAITGPAGSVTLQFAAAGLTSVTSGPIAIGAGTATQLAFITSPSTTATNQVPFASQPAIQLRDASNNPVPTAGVTVIVSVTSGNGAVTTAGATTDATGIATYTNLGLFGTVGNYNIQFVAGALPPLPFGPIALSGRRRDADDHRHTARADGAGWRAVHHAACHSDRGPEWKSCSRGGNERHRQHQHRRRNTERHDDGHHQPERCCDLRRPLYFRHGWRAHTALCECRATERVVERDQRDGRPWNRAGHHYPTVNDGDERNTARHAARAPARGCRR